MTRGVAWALWIAAALIAGSCAGAVSATMPAVAAWIGVSIGLATVGAAMLLYRKDHHAGARR